MELLIAKILISASSVVLVLVPLYFIGHRVYRDGVFGRIGLAGISASAGLTWNEIVFGGADYMSLLFFVTMFFVSVAIFIGWHLLRWHRRVVLGRRDDPITTPRDAFQLRRIG